MSNLITKGYKVNDRYEILKTIGEGGMANVYLAHDTILDRDVAVKVLRGDLAEDEKFVRRFQREAISASSLSHPNIVEMYDVGEDNGQYYIVMEYISGKTLKSLIKKRVYLTMPEVIDIMMQLASGIAHAHDSYIIHRDIKPQNVMIVDDGMVKITDFGIATAMNAIDATQTNSVMGSVYYLPPEQANGTGSTLKSDIYSLGILMYELLTGKVPFKGENAVEIAIKHMKEDLPSACKIKPDIPQSVENIILKASAKNPKNRYDNVREMYEDLKVCLNEEHTSDKKYIYPFAEHEDNTKIEKTLINIPKLFFKKEGEKENMAKETKKGNLLLIASATLFIALTVLMTFFIIIYPTISKIPEVKIPNVAGLTRDEAIKKIEDLGLKVSEETYAASDTVTTGLVIDSSPKEGLVVKKGRAISIIISTGSKKITLANYTGISFLDAQNELEDLGIIVLREFKNVTYSTTLNLDKIIEQSPASGSEVKTGQTVTLYTAKPMYPNFLDGSWTLAKIEAFLSTYDVSITVEYLETSEHAVGTVIGQSASKNTPIWNNATITITIAAVPTDVGGGDIITE